jgi:hypothetical protein
MNYLLVVQVFVRTPQHHRGTGDRRCTLVTQRGDPGKAPKEQILHRKDPLTSNDEKVLESWFECSEALGALAKLALPQLLWPLFSNTCRRATSLPIVVMLFPSAVWTTSPLLR